MMMMTMISTWCQSSKETQQTWNLLRVVLAGKQEQQPATWGTCWSEWKW